MQNNDKITVITVVLNDSSNIKQTLFSVANQSYSKIEHVIIDGGSTDGTLDIINDYIELNRDNDIFLLSENDDGIYDAMNKGVNIATGVYVIFMNCGDVFFSNTVVEQFANECHNDEFVFGDTILKNKDGDEFVCKANIDKILKNMPFVHQSCFVKTDLQRSLKFNTTFEIAADYDFILRSYRKGCCFKKIDRFISIHNIDGVSNSSVFQVSIESSHALLNYDKKINIRNTSYFANIIAKEILEIDKPKVLSKMIQDAKKMRAVSFRRYPIKKILFFFNLIFSFKLFLNTLK